MELNFEDKCGCGEPTRYSTSCGFGSCNKYKRCLSYKEQEVLLSTLQRKVNTYEFYLEQIVRVNAMDYEYKSWAKTALDNGKE